MGLVMDLKYLNISLKELRETLVWLKIIGRKQLGHCSAIPAAIAECDELIAVFVSSTKTAAAKAPVFHGFFRLSGTEPSQSLTLPPILGHFTLKSVWFCSGKKI